MGDNPTAAKCQSLCQVHPQCQFFSLYHTGIVYCILHDIKAANTIHEYELAIRGPRVCRYPGKQKTYQGSYTS